MPVFEPNCDASDPAGEAMLARVLFATAEAREAAIARGRRLAEGENPFAAGSAGRIACAVSGVRTGASDDTLTTFAA